MQRRRLIITRDGEELANAPLPDGASIPAEGMRWETERFGVLFIESVNTRETPFERITTVTVVSSQPRPDEQFTMTLVGGPADGESETLSPSEEERGLIAPGYRIWLRDLEVDPQFDDTIWCYELTERDGQDLTMVYIGDDVPRGHYGPSADYGEG